jgi:WD40 repeat protein
MSLSFIYCLTWLVTYAVVRTLTGHRSNCMSVDFHPFGEFFASGSLDTNLKIWDIRRKGCIHTYKGHTRGVNAIRFTPDGRWVVSGGEDSAVKVLLAMLCVFQFAKTPGFSSSIILRITHYIPLYLHLQHAVSFSFFC